MMLKKTNANTAEVAIVELEENEVMWLETAEYIKKKIGKEA